MSFDAIQSPFPFRFSVCILTRLRSPGIDSEELITGIDSEESIPSGGEPIPRLLKGTVQRDGSGRN
jgi:hypothetical protein